MTAIMIETQFCGPPHSGNGGYTAGLLGKHFDGPSCVRLHSPPPLDRPLQIVTVDDQLLLKHEALVIASAKPTRPLAPAPSPPSLQQAKAGRECYIKVDQHPFTRCFVCGPRRIAGDGLCVFTGPVAGTDLVACDWVAHANFVDDQGHVREEFIWSALDCPSFFALNIPAKSGKVLLLGKMSASIDHPVPSSDALVVYGWKTHSEGRKYSCGAAIANQDGVVLARAEHLWIELKAATE
ncbi:MAG TPA: hypothetical protein DD440_00630 [Porticoccaceae bacterium]|nr:hypothetical protein [Porticoccaceae bacterium]